MDLLYVGLLQVSSHAHQATPTGSCPAAALHSTSLQVVHSLSDCYTPKADPAVCAVLVCSMHMRQLLRRFVLPQLQHCFQ